MFHVTLSNDYIAFYEFIKAKKFIEKKHLFKK